MAESVVLALKEFATARNYVTDLASVEGILTSVDELIRVLRAYEAWRNDRASVQVRLATALFDDAKTDSGDEDSEDDSSDSEDEREVDHEATVVRYAHVLQAYKKLVLGALSDGVAVRKLLATEIANTAYGGEVPGRVLEHMLKDAFKFLCDLIGVLYNQPFTSDNKARREFAEQKCAQISAARNALKEFGRYFVPESIYVEFFHDVVMGAGEDVMCVLEHSDEVPQPVLELAVEVLKTETLLRNSKDPVFIRAIYPGDYERTEIEFLDFRLMQFVDEHFEELETAVLGGEEEESDF